VSKNQINATEIPTMSCKTLPMSI